MPRKSIILVIFVFNNALHRPMIKLRTASRGIIGFILGLFLTLALLLQLPFFQRAMGGWVADALSDKVGAPVSVGSVQLGLNGRIVVQDLRVLDRQGRLLLTSNRVAARLNLWSLLKKQVRIGNAQLIGMEAHLVQERPDTATNFQFLVDAFSSRSDKPGSLDMSVGQLIVRRAHVTWNQQWKPVTPGKFNPAHLDLSQLNTTLQLNVMRPDSMNIEVKRFDAREHSGLAITSLKTNYAANKQGAALSDMELAMPGSRFFVPRITLGKRPSPIQLELQGTLAARDFAPFYPPLAHQSHSALVNIQASLSGDTLSIHNLSAREMQGLADVRLSGQAIRLGSSLDSLQAHVDIQRCDLSTSLATPYVRHPLLRRAADIQLSGPLSWDCGKAEADLTMTSPYGKLSVEGTRQRNGNIDVKAHTDGLELQSLLEGTAQVPVTHLEMTARATGNPKEELNIEIDAPRLATTATQLHNIHASGKMDARGTCEVEASVKDNKLSFESIHIFDTKYTYFRSNIYLFFFDPNALGLTKGHEGENLSAHIKADLQGESWKHPQGTIQLNKLVHSTPTDTVRMGDIHITAHATDASNRHIKLVSPWLEAQLDGNFSDFRQLGSTLQRLGHTYMPILVNAPHTAGDNDWARLRLRLYDATPLKRLADIPLTVNRPLILSASANASSHSAKLSLSAPDTEIGSEHLYETNVELYADKTTLNSDISTKRKTKKSLIALGLNTTSQKNGLNHTISWDNNHTPSIAGSVNINTLFSKAADGRPLLTAKVQPSTVSMADSLWNIHPATLTFHNGTLNVDNLSLAGGSHSVNIHGTASKLETDTLHADIRNLKVEYIFSFFKFRSVEFSGESSGHVTATQLFSSPKIDAQMQLPHLNINGANMGLTDIYVNWGHKPKSIYIDAVLTDLENNSLGLASGYITPSKTAPNHGLDLDIRAEKLNIGFLNKYTKSVFSQLDGRASGYTRIYGPFKTIQLQGDLCVDELQIDVPYVGTTYRAQGDSIHLRPGHIYFPDVTAYDPQGQPGLPGHQAKVRGDLTFTTFNRMQYDVDIEGQNVLGYNFPQPSGSSFWGQVWADGRVHINGEPGRVDININARPTRGTTFTYNMTLPEYMMENQFVHYDSAPLTPSTPTGTDTTHTVLSTPTPNRTADMHINFDLDITPDAQMVLLMDAKAGDRIVIDGNGKIRATYYNKGAFNIYGNYVINRGNYGLTLQNIIHKDFQISPESSITFSGNPLNASLNVTATHTVTGVSLNDLSARATFNNSSARVNCIMNITGQARQPRLDFDFDILNVNDDEKQMIRSLISTEEERNMQVIYLLGIGRFYTYDYQNADQSQSAVAMNSLLSSTLSGQLNQMFQNIIGHRNWNVGASLATGEMGWSDIDVEGSVQGSLLDNRLLINGNFGYRDTPANVKQNNFVGDFDIRYHLTPGGNVSLKAYSETNDRYFTKSSLTTQGVGILLRKDFKNLRDLFTTRRSKRNRNKGNQEKGTPYTPAISQE